MKEQTKAEKKNPATQTQVDNKIDENDEGMKESTKSKIEY